VKIKGGESSAASDNRRHHPTPLSFRIKRTEAESLGAVGSLSVLRFTRLSNDRSHKAQTNNELSQSSLKGIPIPINQSIVVYYRHDKMQANKSKSEEKIKN